MPPTVAAEDMMEAHDCSPRFSNWMTPYPMAACLRATDKRWGAVRHGHGEPPGPVSSSSLSGRGRAGAVCPHVWTVVRERAVRAGGHRRARRCRSAIRDACRGAGRRGRLRVYRSERA